MSETPTPKSEVSAAGTGQTKRRGLALPPRGQALARLQDLEQDAEVHAVEGNEATFTSPDEESKSTASSNAVNTASSNAVNHQGSTPPTSTSKLVAPPAASAHYDPPAAITAGHPLQTRPTREPTTRITVDMPDSLHRKISMLAAETRRSIKDLVLEALVTTYFAVDSDRS